VLDEAGGTERVLRAIYSLRFLGEAFRARPEPIAPFRAALGAKVRMLLTETEDLLHQKIAVEAVGVLAPTDAEAALLAALDSSSGWLQETAFGACRYLSVLPKTVEQALTGNLLRRSQMFILFPDRDLNYLLTVSDLFRPVLQRFRAARVDLANSLIAAIVILAVVPQVAYMIPLGIAIQSLIWATLRGRFVRLQVARGGFTSPILTAPEFFLGALRPTATFVVPIMVLVGGLNHLAAAMGLGPFITDDAPIKHVGALEYALMAILFFAAIPIFGTFWMLAQKRLSPADLRWPNLAWLTRRLIFWAAALIPVGSFYYLLFQVPETYWLYVSAVLSVPIAGFLVRELITNLRVRLRDRERLVAETVRFVPRHAAIAAVFNAFGTPAGRARYVDWIERQAARHDHLAALADIVANPWPNGRRPNLGDAASTRLARLDERWLKLDV